MKGKRECSHVLGVAADAVDEVGGLQLASADSVHRGEQGEPAT